MREFSAPMRQVAALALLLLAVALAVLTTFVPFTTRAAQLREQIDAERTLLGRFGAIAAQQGQVADYDRIGGAAVESGAYLKGETEALKAAGLQTVLSELAAANKVRLYSTRALGPRERDEVRLIGVRVQFKAEIEQLRALLHRIEANRPFLFVEALQVQPVSAFSQRDPELAGVLDVRLDVFGAIPGRKG
jgi:Type II secretion system (T2SS), protein M subtype b